VGHTYGSCPLWSFGSAPTWCDTQSAPFNTWQNNLDSPGSIGVGNVGKLMRSRSWRSMVPDYSNSTVLSAKSSGLYYRATAREANGQTIMAWARDTNLVTVDITKIHGSLAHAWWYSPADGTSIDLGTFSTTGTTSFIPPASRLVLVLDDASRGLAAPGTTTYSFAPDTACRRGRPGLLATPLSASRVHLCHHTDPRHDGAVRAVRSSSPVNARPRRARGGG